MAVQSKEEYALDLARDVLETLRPVYFVERDEILVPENGVLEEFGEARIRKLVEEKAHADNTVNLFNLVLHHIRGRVPKYLSDFVQPSRYINVKNGIVDIETG